MSMYAFTLYYRCYLKKKKKNTYRVPSSGGKGSHSSPVSLPRQPSKSEATLPHSKYGKVSLGKGGDPSGTTVPTEIRPVSLTEDSLALTTAPSP